MFRLKRLHLRGHFPGTQAPGADLSSSQGQAKGLGQRGLWRSGGGLKTEVGVSLTTDSVMLCPFHYDVQSSR